MVSITPWAVSWRALQQIKVLRVFDGLLDPGLTQIL